MPCANLVPPVNAIDERSVPLWSSAIPDFPSLTEDTTADVAVVGAGIAGLSSAYELARDGLAVVVLDRGRPAGGMTGRTTAHLATTFDNSYARLIRDRGVDVAKGYCASQCAALDRIEAIIAAEAIDCDFRRLDAYTIAVQDEDRKYLQEELEAYRSIGLTDVGWVDRAPLSGRDTGRCLRIANQGRYHPLKYAGGLIRGLLARTGRVFANSAVVAIEEDQTGVTVRTSSHAVRAKQVVVATLSPVDARAGIHTKQTPIRTYVQAGRVPRGTVADALFWDTADPYHYVRIQPDAEGDWLIFGGEDHRTGEADDGAERQRKVEAWARGLFPELGAVEYCWSGQIMEPIDHVGFIGRAAGTARTFICTGDSGHGLTTATTASLLLRDLIAGRDNPYVAVYDPARPVTSALAGLGQEVAVYARNLVARVLPGENRSTDDVAPGEGAVVSEGGEKIAAYRDAAGVLHTRSAICSHMGCVVSWNSFERCWDCPCHGSHYAVDGRVLGGPAVAPLPIAPPRSR